MKQMTQTKLLRYVTSDVMTYAELEVTNCILGDVMVDVKKLLNWLIDGRAQAQEPFYIAIRKHGIEAGYKDYVDERCAALGKPICTIEISKMKEPSGYCEYEVRQY